MQKNGFLSINWQHYDVHPPTYYSLLYGWSFLNPGLSEYHWGMELSVLMGLLFLTVIFIGLTRMFGKEGAFATVMLSLCPTYLHYGTEVRMYMLVLFLSAIIFTAIVKGVGEHRWWRWGAYVSLMFLTMTHYLAAMAIPFFVVLYYVVEKKRKNIDGNIIIRMLISAAMGVLLAMQWALPQKARVAGMWFQGSGLSDFFPALYYAFSIMPVSGEYSPVGDKIFAGVLVVFIVVVVGVAVAAMLKVWRRKLDEQGSVLLLMGLTALFPFVYLLGIVVGQMVLGRGGFLTLYHPRFFLVVVWMFAAAMFVAMLRWIRKQRMVIVVGVVVVFIIWLITVNVLYVTSAHYELRNMMEATPCGAAGEYILIGHESPFSSLPYEVYAREHGCHWKNFISTGISNAMANSAGFDAVYDSQVVYWNVTLPEEGFYYVRSTEKAFPLDEDGRTYKVIAQDEGIWLLYVDKLNKSQKKGGVVEVSFR